MLRLKNRLTVLTTSNGVAFTDYSDEALDYSRDNFNVQLAETIRYTYVGFYKPISALYLEVSSVNTVTGTDMTGEYHNGTDWTSLENYIDETDAVRRSGFTRWSRNQTDEATTTVDGVELYWYRFQVAGVFGGATLTGLNIVYSDDQDLINEHAEVMNKLPDGATSFIKKHVAARDEIIQWIRNNGHSKKDIATSRLKDISAFDVLDVGQVRLASKYLTLSKIFFDVSDEADDIYMQKYREYRGMYRSAIKTFFLDLDTDDDGISDQNEELASNTVYLVRR